LLLPRNLTQEDPNAAVLTMNLTQNAHKGLLQQFDQQSSFSQPPPKFRNERDKERYNIFSDTHNMRRMALKSSSAKK